MASFSPPVMMTSTLAGFSHHHHHHAQQQRGGMALTEYAQTIVNVIEQTPTPPLESLNFSTLHQNVPPNELSHRGMLHSPTDGALKEVYSKYSHELFVQILQVLREYLLGEFPHSLSPQVERFLHDHVCEWWWRIQVRAYDENVPPNHHHHHYSFQQRHYSHHHHQRVVTHHHSSQQTPSCPSSSSTCSSHLLSFYSNCEHKVRELLNTTCPHGNKKILAVASASGYPHVVEWLIEMGCQIDSESPPGRRTPLFIAALKGHLPVVRVLLEKGASPHHESLFSDDVVMVSYYCGVVRQRVYLTPEKAALKAGHSQVAHFIREFDLEMNRAKKRGLNKFFKHTKELCLWNSKDDEERWFHGEAPPVWRRDDPNSLSDISFTLH